MNINPFYLYFNFLYHSMAEPTSSLTEFFRNFWITEKIKLRNDEYDLEFTRAYEKYKLEGFTWLVGNTMLTALAASLTSHPGKVAAVTFCSLTAFMIWYERPFEKKFNELMALQAIRYESEINNLYSEYFTGMALSNEPRSR